MKIPKKEQYVGLAKKFIQVFHETLPENPNKLYGQVNIFRRLGKAMLVGQKVC